MEEQELSVEDLRFAQRGWLTDFVVCRVCAYTAVSFRLKLSFGGFQKGINPGRGGSAIGGARLLVAGSEQRADDTSTLQASRYLGVSKARAPPPGACDNMISALKLLANLVKEENFTEIVQEGMRESSKRKALVPPRQLIEVDNRPEELTFKVGERMGQKVFVDTTRTGCSCTKYFRKKQRKWASQNLESSRACSGS